MEVFGPYRLDGLLGRGGMGEVWRGRDTRKDGREVAVKLLSTTLGADPGFARRFRREAALAARLHAPNIVPIHDYGEIDHRLFIEMPLIPRENLRELVERHGPLAPGRAVRIVTQLGRALSALHRAGLVHRDVKPSNVLVTDAEGEDHVYLIDFGIARSLDGTHSLAGAGIGTPAYMAPEQFAGAGDRRADVYSLGCVLYEALTRHPPFTGDNPVVLMHSHITLDPPRPSGRCPEVSAALDDVVVRAMAKDPDQRYDTVAEFTDAARAAVELPAPDPAALPVGDPTPDPAAPAARTGNADADGEVAAIPDRPAVFAAAGRTTLTASGPPRPADTAPRDVTGEAGPGPRFTAGPVHGAAVPATTTSVPATGASVPATGASVPATGASVPATTTSVPATTTADPSTGRPTPGPQMPGTPPSVAAPVSTRRRRVVQVAAAALVLVAGLIAAVALLPLGQSPAVESGLRPIRTLSGHTDVVNAVTTTRLDGRPVVVSGGTDRTIRVWDPVTGAPIGQPITGHAYTVSAVAIAQLGGRPVIVSGSPDNTIRVWDLATHAPVGAPIPGCGGAPPPDYRNATACTVTTGELDGRTVIVSGGTDGALRVWDLATHAPVGIPIPGPIDDSEVLAVVTAQLDGRPVVVSSSYPDATIRVWDLATHAPVGAPVPKPGYLTYGLATGQLTGRPVVVSGGTDGTLLVWDLATHAPVGSPILLHTETLVTTVTIAELDGRPVIVAGGYDQTTRIWDLETHAPVGLPTLGHTGEVTSVATAEVDGQFVIVSGGVDGTVLVQEPTGAR